jgi:flagellar basal body-associated protein FliL
MKIFVIILILVLALAFFLHFQKQPETAAVERSQSSQSGGSAISSLFGPSDEEKENMLQMKKKAKNQLKQAEDLQKARMDSYE